MTDTPALHVLGCGRAARAVARRLIDTGLVEPGLIVNRSLESARQAVDFLGGGDAARRLDERIADGWLMFGLPDGVLAECSDQFEWIGSAAPELVFHLSGSVEAATLKGTGTPFAAVHPVRAFAEPASAVERFAGTWCVAEGDPAVLERLQPVFEAAGARWLPFAACDKASWHAATVAASNFLVTIQDLARQLAERAGLPEAQAAEVLCDLQQGTLESLRERTPRQALTGPIERGDEAACRRLAKAAAGLDAERARLFAQLGQATLSLAQEKRGERPADGALGKLFSPTSD